MFYLIYLHRYNLFQKSVPRKHLRYILHQVRVHPQILYPLLQPARLLLLLQQQHQPLLQTVVLHYQLPYVVLLLTHHLLQVGYVLLPALQLLLVVVPHAYLVVPHHYLQLTLLILNCRTRLQL